MADADVEPLENSSAASATYAAGGCLCGSVRYRINGALRDVLICHCRMCRRQHTLAGAYTACGPAELELTNADGLRWYQSSADAGRGFCSLCGSGLFWAPAHGRHISIALGSLDTPEALNLAGHIFEGQRLALLDGDCLRAQPHCQPG